MTSSSRSARPRRRLAALAAAATAVALLLSGCTSWFQPPRPAATVSKPTGEKVAADLEPFYSQVLHWTSCAGGFQCATATAPMNWGDPGQASIKLALIRHLASGTPLGSLLVNPGGPGASGVDFVKQSLSYAVDAKLEQNYDIVGFDPRGVGASSAVDCGGAQELDRFIYGIVPGTPGTDAWIAAAEQENGQFGQSCLQHTGALLQYVDTVSAAHDLDLLRAVLGDKKLNYLGYSYGTFLGATYADLYPKKTGRLVLDGALDPATTDFDVTLTQAKGFESAFRAYLKNCIGQKDCPFHGSVDAAMDETHQLLQKNVWVPISFTVRPRWSMSKPTLSATPCACRLAWIASSIALRLLSSFTAWATSACAAKPLPFLFTRFGGTTTPVAVSTVFDATWPKPVDRAKRSFSNLFWSMVDIA